MGAIKRVAVIGAGPAGAIAIDALAKEKAFDVIRVFERREASGGCCCPHIKSLREHLDGWRSWQVKTRVQDARDENPDGIGDKGAPPHLTDFTSLADRTADRPIPVPESFPAQTPTQKAPRFTESGIYPYLETNVDAIPMSFSDAPISEERTPNSIALHGPSTPFRHWTVMRDYVRRIVDEYEGFVSYNTTVELAEKVGDEWKVVLRKEGKDSDEWWVERFDAVVVATGHYWVPYVPKIDGLEEFEGARPGSVIHSKHYRGREDFCGKRVVVVGASVSGADISVDLINTAKLPIYSVVNGRKANLYFGDGAFHHPKISRQATISRIEGRTVHFIDGTSVSDVDSIIFATGFTWTLPFLPSVEVRNNRVTGLYQHVIYHRDPTLLFIGAVAAGLTFKIFEWQAVLAARVLSGRARLPPAEEQAKWEADRVAEMGDKFPLVHPHFEEYFETVRALAGEPENGVGRRLPPFDPSWFQVFLDGLELRRKMWVRLNAKAQEELLQADGLGATSEALVAEKTPLVTAIETPQEVAYGGHQKGTFPALLSRQDRDGVSESQECTAKIQIMSTTPPSKPSRLPAASRLGRRIKEFDIMGILQPPRLMPEFLASDVAGFFLHVVLATDWSSFWKTRLFQAFPFSQTIAETFTDFWRSFWDERWHTENLLEERARKWSPHLYKAMPPRLRTYREILNRQQALKNCCDAQFHGLDTPEVARNMLLQIAMATCWMWALFQDHMAVVWLLAEIENRAQGYRQKIEFSVPPVERIDRGQGLITRFMELELCPVERDENIWSEDEWLVEKDGEIPADMPDEDRFLVNRVVFSAGLSWFMVSISCDFATFYLSVLLFRLRSRVLG
ncbi:dimethylaniline monooxygenase [Colletotrichum asianum]|uniref:Dimethylaniline monooxygenase n=1 Tax=Colletotrichum asianum TaxID=702518 RepID=A0A8H3WHE1_9PEZI|nr:dimethylaniline monooxygenase [Colletotrichum asianum]